MNEPRTHNITFAVTVHGNTASAKGAGTVLLLHSAVPGDEAEDRRIWRRQP